MNRIFVICVLMLWIPADLLASGWTEYNARYSLYRNGKLAGKADMKLERNGETWMMSTEGNGTHGLARVLRARDREYVEGHFVEGRFRPRSFEHSVTVAGIGSKWSAQFDWAADTVVVEVDKETHELELAGEALDPLSLKLEMQRRLRNGEEDMRFLLVDEDEIEEQVFRIKPREMLETSLGCLETIPVERVRDPSSSRYTRAWYAPKLEFLTVRLEHGKVDGDHMEMRIAELQQGEQPFKPGMGCSAHQGDD